MSVMATLYHWRLDPFSRQARIAAGEKGVRMRLKEERVWDGRQAFLALNPAGSTPVLVVEPGAGRTVVVGARALLEYLEETEPDPPLLPAAPAARAEARRLADWFDRKYDAEVNAAILHERVERLVTGQGAPDGDALAQGREALARHLHYVSQLAEDRGGLAGERFGLADLAAAAHLSVADYLGEVDWDAFPAAARWYEGVKSRPSFRPLLEDRLPGLPPDARYAAARP
ncbi:MAG: glutathione S-transferase family protein [Caulobacterales bacterium]|nr:glutathione S-transferase family protein [Caulobacterales bacterium]